MKVICFLLITVILVTGCASLKGELIRSGSSRDAIQNAILDFSKTVKSYKKDSVFSVSFHDTLYKLVLEKIDSSNYGWVLGEAFEEIIAVGIRASYDQFLLTADTKIGSKRKLPSRFIVKDGKLFYWWDDDYPLTEEALAVFKKYHLLEDDKGGLLTMLDNPVNDARKAAHYYFCRNDLLKYRKIITNKGMGYYDPPKPECDH